MGFFGIFLLALGEAMDAVAVSLAAGVAAKDRLGVVHVVKCAVVFGGMQGLMPAAGYGLGTLVGPSVAAFDHWIAFGILSILGLLALKEALGPPDDDAAVAVDFFGWRRMLLLGVATSIDAFAVGVTLPMIGAPLLLSCVTIGVVTAVLCAVAVVVGARAGARFGNGAGVVGGLALIAMGAWILFDHLRP